MSKDCKGRIDEKIQFLSKSFTHTESTTRSNRVGLAKLPTSGIGSVPRGYSRARDALVAHLESTRPLSVKKKPINKKCRRQRGTVEGRDRKREAGFLKLGVIDSLGWQLLKMPEMLAGRWAGGRSSKHMCHPKWVFHNDKHGGLRGSYGWGRGEAMPKGMAWLNSRDHKEEPLMSTAK